MVRKTIQSISLVKLGIIFVLVGITVLLGLFVLGVIPLPFGNKKQGGSQKVGIFDAKPGSCLVLEQKFCDQLVLKDNLNYPGEKIAYGKFPIGTKIFAPGNGLLKSNNNFVLKPKQKNTYIYETGYDFEVATTDSEQDQYLYSIIFYRSQDNKVSKNAQTGEVIDQITQDKTYSLEDYNFAFTKSMFDTAANKYINQTQVLLNK